MEHIVQFGISIDDEKIKKTIEDNAQKTLNEEIKKMINSSLGINSNCPSYQVNERIRNLVSDNIDTFLENHKDEIIDIASDKLMERLSRTKKVKEMVEGIVETIKGE